jgi:hypothetical protein
MPTIEKSEIVFYDKDKTLEQALSESENITGNIADSTTLPTHTKDRAVEESTAREDVEDVNDEIVATKEKLTNLYDFRDEKVKTWKDKRNHTAVDVESTLDNSGTAMGDLGYNTKIIGEKSPVDLCGKIVNVRAKQSDFTGCVKIRWKADKRRKFYKIQWTFGDPLNEESWKNADKSKETGEVSYLIMNESPGSRLYARVCGKNAAGQGPWSDVVNIIVP